MAVVRVQDRIAEVVKGVLVEMAAPEDEVQYEVWMTDHYEECPDDEPDCEHFVGEVINIFLSLLIGPGECGHPHYSESNWAMLSKVCYDNGYVEGRVRQAFDQIKFHRDTLTVDLSGLDQELQGLVEDHKE